MHKNQEQQLNDLILNPQKNSSTWQDEVSRLVGLAHTRAINTETDQTKSFHLMALIYKAQLCGCRNANKFVLNTARFKQGFSENFQLPECAKEQLFYLAILSKIKSDWCVSFVENELLNKTFEKPAYALLISWLAKNSKSIEDFFGKGLTPVILSNTPDALKLSVVKEFHKRQEILSFRSSSAAAKEVQSMFVIIAPLIRSSDITIKVKRSLIKLLSSYIDSIRQKMPTLLLEPFFLTGIIEFGREVPKEQLSKDWAEKSKSLMHSTAALISGVLTLDVDARVVFPRELVSLFEKSYPGFKKVLEVFARDAPNIGVLLNNEDLVDKTTFDSGPEMLGADLLLRLASISSNPAIDHQDFRALIVDINRLCQNLGLSYLGMKGEVELYDPLAHRPLNKSTELRSKVRVLTQGIKFARPDGSLRVLYPALVEFTQE